MVVSDLDVRAFKNLFTLAESAGIGRQKALIWIVRTGTRRTLPGCPRGRRFANPEARHIRTSLEICEPTEHRRGPNMDRWGGRLSPDFPGS